MTRVPIASNSRAPAWALALPILTAAATTTASPGIYNPSQSRLMYTFLGPVNKKTKLPARSAVSVLRIYATCSVLICLGVNGFAHSHRATITGSCTDPTGALIPAAKMTLPPVEPDTRSETVSTNTGTYTLPALPVGNYTL